MFCFHSVFLFILPVFQLWYTVYDNYHLSFKLCVYLMGSGICSFKCLTFFFFVTLCSYTVLLNDGMRKDVVVIVYALMYTLLIPHFGSEP